MNLPSKAVSEADFKKLIKDFISDKCKKVDGRPVCKKCGDGIRTGFANCFFVENGVIDAGSDGFGIGPVRVPYCENCDPPDGFNYTYAQRVFIKKKE